VKPVGPTAERTGGVPASERPSPPRALRLVGAARGDDDVTTQTIEKPERSRRRRRFGQIYGRKWASGRRTWSAIWWCDQQRRRLTRDFDTEKAAKDFLAELERRVVARMYEVPPTIVEAKRKEEQAPVAEKKPVPTLVAYADKVIDERFDAVLSPGAMGIFRSALKAWRKWFGRRDGRAARRLDQVSPADWLDYRAWRASARQSRHGAKTTVGPRTLNCDLACLIRVLNHAVVDGHIDKNPLAGTKKLREPTRPRRYLTKAELALLIAHAEPKFKPLLLAAIYTGARKGELTALRWRDVDFESGKIALFRPKVGNCDYVDLHPALAEELRRVRKEREDPAADEHVFLSWFGTPWVDIRKSWNIALKGAGLLGREGITFHSLRHSFATHFLEGGGSVTDLMTQLGHSKLETTQIYAASISGRRRATVMAMDFGVLLPQD